MTHGKCALSFAICLSMMLGTAEGAKRHRRIDPPVQSEVSTKPFSFVAPKGWQCIDNQDELPGLVEILYIGVGKTGQFTPSINLATEETDLSIEEYVTMAKDYHEEQAETLCRRLGSLQTVAGRAHILQIDRLTRWGNICFLQATLVREGKAYVLTATALKEDYQNYQASFFRAIQSFTLNTQPAKTVP